MNKSVNSEHANNPVLTPSRLVTRRLGSLANEVAFRRWMV